MGKFRYEGTFVLRYEDGTYFQGFSGIGPRFGGTLAEAHQFMHRFDAASAMGRHWAMGGCELEDITEDTPDA